MVVSYTREVVIGLRERIDNYMENRSLPLKIFDVVFWGCFVILMSVWLTDFFRVKANKKPVFCLSEKTHQFEDGTVNECVGLGYKVYEYHRQSLNNAYQFSPFFVGMKK